MMPGMLDSETTSDVGAKWRGDDERIAARFNGDGAPRTTHSGIPLKPCYLPEDGPDRGPEAPGQYPFTRANLAAQYQFMTWANQPVIGYGLPEQTRQRMDLLAEQGMVGYFRQRFYNLVYDLVSHAGLDPDH